MPRTMLTDQHWSKLKSIVHNFGIYLKYNLRNFIEAILYRIRTGCPWQDLPEPFGKSNTIFKWFTRWSKDNKLLKIFKLLSKYADLEWVFIDTSHIRAHQHAKGLKNQAISRSIGGNSSKIHLAVDSNGNPIQFLIHDGTTHDMKVTPALLNKIDLTDTDVLSADKGYDSKALREQIEETATKVNIPKKSNTRSNNNYMDWYLYKIRHLVENTFAKLKQFRGIATRYDKLKQNYENSVALACIFIWLSL
ncbi:IS5 family transposase [Acinetobacter qingfengensis]|uniref:IS5 family transposase n=1 Tax=Acinetobacter qingfengensis TaxID=1262585 RepID=A0A1E7REU6_9GAMM|nr:IS5 family transposase [Acinetobacter qingfengensis]KAA8735632.1 IS5 family transposase [Acinetobacter qingfengensis]OEY97919.1 IS5 family transposase [Acinetobacter qingfengensis]